MSIYSYFFNAVKSEEGTYDREYTAEDFANYLRKLVGDGVFIDPSTNLQVIAGSGMQVIVKEGEAWGKGHKLVNDADLPLTIEASDVALSRIDRVIFYIDYTNRKMDIRIKKGTNASSPQPPALQRDENIYEYCLAEVTVNRQAISITQSSIRDTRANSAVCGWVAGLISQIDTSTLFDQWNTALDENIEQNQSDFLTWFDNVKDTLTTTTLVRQYKTTYTTKIANEKTFNVNISQFNSVLDILEVYVNGIRLNSDEYTYDLGVVTLTNALDVIGTKVEFVVIKSVDGSDAETVISQVEDLQGRVTALENSEETFIYKCTGIDDNKKLSQLAQDFLSASNDFAGTPAYAQMTVLVVGTLGISDVDSGSGSNDDPYVWFNLGKYKNLNTDINTVTSTRKIIFDFSNATRISVGNRSGGSSGNATVLFGGSDLTIKGVQAVLGGQSSSLYWFNGDNVNVFDSELYLNATSIAVGTQKGGMFKNCRLSVTSDNSKAIALNSDGTTILKAVDCYILCYNGTGVSDESVCILAEANKTNSVVIVERCNMPLVTRNGYKQSQTIKINSGYCSLVSNVLGKASTKYSSDTSKCTEVGTMIVSKQI